MYCNKSKCTTIFRKCTKPLKPKTTIQVVTEQSEKVVPIKIFGATYRNNDTLCICYGKENILTFENIVSTQIILFLIKSN